MHAGIALGFSMLAFTVLLIAVGQYVWSQRTERTRKYLREARKTCRTKGVKIV